MSRATETELWRLDTNSGFSIFKEWEMEKGFISFWDKDVRMKFTQHHVVTVEITVNDRDGGRESKRDEALNNNIRDGRVFCFGEFREKELKFKSLCGCVGDIELEKRMEEVRSAEERRHVVSF